MRYWAYFLAKLALLAVLLRQAWLFVYRLFPEPETFLRYKLPRFPYDLQWTAAMLFFFLASVGLLYLVVWDQKRRCRVCLRRLRMPVEKGHWGMATLLSPVHSESICPYGHGTLAEPEVHTTSTQAVEWRGHSEDIWRELEAIDKRK